MNIGSAEKKKMGSLKLGTAVKVPALKTGMIGIDSDAAAANMGNIR